MLLYLTFRQISEPMLCFVMLWICLHLFWSDSVYHYCRFTFNKEIWKLTKCNAIYLFNLCKKQAFSESQILHCNFQLFMSVHLSDRHFFFSSFFSVCHAVYWKLKVCMGANNRNSWQEAPEASHKSKGKFDVIASLKLNPAQTEYLAAALCTTLHSHALWYEGGMKVHIGTRLYSVQCLEAHAQERQQTMSGMFSHIRNGLCNEESCHEVVLWCITNIR